MGCRNITVIENLEMCTSLSNLYLSENQIAQIGAAFKAPHGFRNLVQLSLDDNLL
jgi:internalin A